MARNSVARIERELARRLSPRLHMLGLISAATAVAMLASFVTLKAGLTSMAIRYPLAVIAGYAAFLGLIALWVRRFRLRERSAAARSSTTDEFALDVVQVPLDAMWSGPSVVDAAAPSSGFGGGGGFSGAGAGRVFGGGSGSGSGGGGKSSGLDLDIGDDAWPLVVAGVIAAIAFGAALYIVVIAPTLFAELLLNAAIGSGVYRKLRDRPSTSWFQTAFRQTIIPAAIMTVLLGVSGFILQTYYPGASSIGRVWERIWPPVMQRER